MKKHLAILVFSLIITCFIANAQQQVERADGKKIPLTSIDRIVTKLMDTSETTGLCIGIINDNKAVYVKSYGYKNKTKNEWNDTSTCFYAASLAKPVFAFLVMQLVDEKLIDLDKPLYTYLPKPLPEYDDYKDLAVDEQWKLITARHCLSHTTGFPNWREFSPGGNKKLKIFFTPGKKYAYSGEGLFLLQFIVETITGKKLEELASEKIFNPFGMTRTSFIWQKSFENNYALGHTMNEDTIPKSKRKKQNAAGSMETTIADYTRFVTALMQGKGLSQRSKQEMLSPQIPVLQKHQFPSLNTDTTDANKKIQLSYGLGWGLFTSPYGRTFFKEGHDEGWEHYMISFPDKKNAVIILTNSSNGESMFKELVEETTGVTIPWEWEGYTPYRATVKLPANILQQFVGVYDGKLKAIISLVNGQLKVESPTVNLSKTNLYAVNDHHFFLKVMDAEIEFVKGADGKIEKAVLNDEGEHYELKKISN